MNQVRMTYQYSGPRGIFFPSDSDLSELQTLVKDAQTEKKVIITTDLVTEISRKDIIGIVRENGESIVGFGILVVSDTLHGRIGRIQELYVLTSLPNRRIIWSVLLEGLFQQAVIRGCAHFEISGSEFAFTDDSSLIAERLTRLKSIACTSYHLYPILT